MTHGSWAPGQGTLGRPQEDFGAMSPEDFTGDETPQTSQDIQDDYGYGSDFGFNQGGLAAKPKPKKTKKMKKGGLASKK